jgi:DNA relaxase NicK
VRTNCHQDSNDWHDNAEGATFYGGSRNSTRFMRVYDRRGPTRLELQLKGNYATSFIRHLSTEDYSNLPHLGIGYLRNFIDFIDRRSNTNISRCDLLPWWMRLVGDVEKIKVATITVEEQHSFERSKLTEFYNRLLPTLYLVKHGLGRELEEDVEQASSRLKAKHKARLKRLIG